VPADGDTYATLVARALDGAVVDWGAMRHAYLKSAARRRDWVRPGAADERAALFAAMKRNDYAAVAGIARGILSHTFVDLDAHKALRQACEHLGDHRCAELHHAIEMGLLRSVVAGANGESCETGWRVVTVDEEYFVLRMIDLKLRKQSLKSVAGHQCDMMETIDEHGSSRTVYFQIDAVTEDEQRALGGR
jgi:hypothetical protein